MRFLRAVVPNLSISMTLALIVLVVLDVFNPVMGFLKGWPFLVLFLLDAAASLTTAVLLYRDWRRS